ncbi:ABC transporter substrate-binding protein [Thermodesulfobacteriota bacterium]
MKRVGFVIAILTTMLLALVSGAMSADKVRGVTDTEIRIGQWGPQTGPAKLWGAVARGSGVLFELVNSEGGIAGRKIKYFMADDAYQPAKTKAIVKEFVEKNKVFAVVGGVGSSTGLAAKDYLVKNNVPWVGPTAGSTHWTQPFERTIFAIYPLYIQEAYLLTQYAVEKMGKKKIAFFYQNDEYGKQGLEGAKKYLKEKGMKLVADVPVEVRDTDLKSHALKMKDAGAEVVIMWVLPKHGAIILGTSKAMGFKPKWISSSTLSDADLMYKITKGLWQGVVYANFLNLDSPLIKKYMAATDKFTPSEKNRGVFFLAGFMFAEPLVQGLKLTGKDLNEDNFIKAMESIKNWNDWLGHDLTYSATEHQGMKSVYLTECGPNGKPKKISDWLTYKGK